MQAARIQWSAMSSIIGSDLTYFCTTQVPQQHMLGRSLDKVLINPF